VATLCDRMGIGAGATATLYEALPEEPPTAGMAEVLQERGVRVLVPLTLPDLDLDWADLADEARAPLGLEGIHDADLVLIPGLAVDASGTRLGQGGGCYDKALPRRAAGQRVIVILHPEEFPAAALPREDHDVLVDAVLTADGCSDITPRRQV
jgi:5-formyltetrahydrofolate cyclo-ligase